MNILRTGLSGAAALVAVGLSAGEGRAEQKLCVNSSTGVTRVVDAAERCRKVETSVVIPAAVQGETVKSSSYLVKNSVGYYLSVMPADNSAELDIYCYVPQATWFALDTAMAAGDAQTFNDISGKPFQAFNDLRYNGGGMDAADVTERPWSGVFTYRYKKTKTLSRFEVTLSEKSNGDCLVTLFAVGLGSATLVKP